jgi:predicted negative regulator of RcsB-dependent stress response
LGLRLAKQGDVAGARAAYQRAIDSGHAEWAPEAAINLGVLLAEQTDVAYLSSLSHLNRLTLAAVAASARAAYQRAIDSGHAEWAPRAAINLGVLLAKQGDVDGAWAAYQRAIDSGHAEWAPKAAASLRRLRWIHAKSLLVNHIRHAGIAVGG